MDLSRVFRLPYPVPFSPVTHAIINATSTETVPMQCDPLSSLREVSDEQGSESF